MARGVNKVIAIGNLGKDPEIRFVPSGAGVCTFSIAATEEWKDKQTGEQKERTEWINVEVWGNVAEACHKYLQKGSQCYVEGKMRTDKWEKDGVTRYTTKVRADVVQFLGSPRDGDQRPPQSNESKPAPQQEFDDDIPF